jgi:GTPase SAR1 family protein
MKDAIQPIFAQHGQTRKNYTAFVFGAQNSGKTAFLRAFIEAPYEEKPLQQ